MTATRLLFAALPSAAEVALSAVQSVLAPGHTRVRVSLCRGSDGIIVRSESGGDGHLRHAGTRR